MEAIPVKDFPIAFESSVPRTGLLDIIESTAAGSVLLCSMAGYGKSVILSQLSNRAQCAAVCILGHGDNDLGFFLNHLSEAVVMAVTGFEMPDAEKPYRALAQICKTAADNRMTMIFDNCHLLNDESVCDAFQTIMSAADNGFNVIIGTRRIPDFAARLVFEGRCRPFGRESLALSEGEVAELVRMFLDKEGPLLARDIYELTGGWAAGVMFCLRSGGAGLADGPLDLDSLTDRRLIKQYIAYEILSGLPEDVAEFARQTALFDSLKADFCDIILDADHSRECLSYLIENDVFLRECPDEPDTFEWIGIFQRFMAESLPTKERSLIIERAAEYYFRHKMHRQGISIALKAGQPALICRALSLCGTSLLEEGRLDLLGSCARVLEKGGDELDAAIFGILAQYYYVVGDYSKMEYNFNMADSMFGKENDYSIQRTLYRGLLKYEKDPQTYRKHVNNALFYLNELNLKLPYLLPREQRILDEILRLSSADEETHDQKPLLVKQFGSFRVIVAEDGREIPWRTKKGGELFAYLISLNEQAVERRHLFDIIWNEELPNNPVAMLHNMIYNIRKELSAYKLENVVQYKNKKYCIDKSLIDSDLDSVSRVCSAISRKDLDTLLENETLIAEYWGVYLENIDSLWITERRDYYDKMFISGSLMMADFYYNSRIYEKALAYLQNALKIDTFSERIMEKILNCYSKMGKFDKLRDKYEGFCEMLSRELDIQPSPDLQSAYQRSIQRKL